MPRRPSPVVLHLAKGILPMYLPSKCRRRPRSPCRRRSSSPACTRPASLLLPPAPSPTDPPLSAYSLLLSLSVLRKHLHCFSMLQAGTECRARTRYAHTCVRWCVGRAWRTLSNALERPCRRCASRHCRLDGPLSNPKRQSARTTSDFRQKATGNTLPAGSWERLTSLATIE